MIEVEHASLINTQPIGNAKMYIIFGYIPLIYIYVHSVFNFLITFVTYLAKLNNCDFMCSLVWKKALKFPQKLSNAKKCQHVKG